MVFFHKVICAKKLGSNPTIDLFVHVFEGFGGAQPYRSVVDILHFFLHVYPFLAIIFLNFHPRFFFLLLFSQVGFDINFKI